MKVLERKIQELLLHKIEEDWFKFEENWYDPYAIGEYISALSNAAALANQPYGYLIWGVNDETFELTGTSFTWKEKFINKDSLVHYLARKITPDVHIRFSEIQTGSSRLVVLEIPAAHQVPASFDGIRYLRIGSGNVHLDRFPGREAFLLRILNYGYPDLINTESMSQDLKFSFLESFYTIHQLPLNHESWKTDLRFYTKNGKYNRLAQLLSDNSYIPIRVCLYKGKNISSPLYNVREFGSQCILLYLMQILDFGKVLNVPITDESDRTMIRKEEDLFSMQAFREAVINAFVHNHWTEGKGPSICVFSDRIEILSRGTLASTQSMEGFFLGEPVPVNKELSDIFRQLHISDGSGDGVSVITKEYGREAFIFDENTVIVRIPLRNGHSAFGFTHNTKEDRLA